MKSKSSNKSKSNKIPQEIVEKVLFLDCEVEENVRRLNKALMKLPFIKTEKDLSTDKLEEFIKKIESKYMLHLSYVMRTYVQGEEMYTCMIKLEKGKEQGKWLKTVYAKTFNEGLAKTLFFMYSYIQNKKK